MQRTTKGFVTLVGAGPGPGLITLKGYESLLSADVIVYDDLLDTDLLKTPELSGTELVYVGKRRGQHSKTQEEINALLIDLASAGKQVVRLKGGDSFVFGRGGEELQALKAAGLPFAVVPGVTSSVAVPEDFGIPVTHRGVSRSFTVVTGHTKDGTGENYEALAALSGTLVFLMGLHNIESIAENLLQYGKAPDTPASLLSEGFSPRAARIDGTLATIADKAKGAATPAILVVGPTADFSFKATVSPSVTVVGTPEFCKKFQRKYPATALPLLELQPVEGALGTVTLSDYDWLAFLSGKAIECFFAELPDLRLLAGKRIAAVGPATAKALAARHLPADFVPSVYNKKTLLAELPKDAKVLYLGVKEAEENPLPAGSTHLGLYETAAIKKSTEITTDAVVFASAGGVKAFFDSGNTLATKNGTAVAIAMGPSTLEALNSYGVSGIAPEHATIEDMIGVFHETFQSPSDQ